MYVWTYFNVNLFSIYKKYTNVSCFSIAMYLCIFSKWELLSSLFSFPLIIFNFKFLFPRIFFFLFLSSYLFTFLHLTCRTVIIVEIIFDPHIHKNYQKTNLNIDYDLAWHPLLKNEERERKREREGTTFLTNCLISHYV